MDRTKEIDKNGIDIAVLPGKKGIEMGREGIDRTKDILRAKTYKERSHFLAMDESGGDCPTARKRRSAANVSICPQCAFAPGKWYLLRIQVIC